MGRLFVFNLKRLSITIPSQNYGFLTIFRKNLYTDKPQKRF
jgi:hypothetical protein